MSDKPKNVINVTALDLEGRADEPIRVPAKDDGFITFASPFDKDAEETDQLLDVIYGAMQTGKVTPALRAWLSDEDFAKFRKAYPSYRASLTILQAVVQRMESSFGTPGEGNASES